MADVRGDGARTAIKRALALTTEALDLIDAHGGPADAAAHLDCARDRLQESLRSEMAESPPSNAA
jgi:hypothetical protein